VKALNASSWCSTEAFAPSTWAGEIDTETKSSPISAALACAPVSRKFAWSEGIFQP
jgi:hypothetical protein